MPKPPQKKHSETGKRGRGKLPRTFSSLAPPTVEESQALAARMPPLAGRPLPNPCFHVTGWRANQRFSARDDPDRTRLPWVAPRFVHEKEPAAQRTQVEDLPVGRGFACVVRHVLDQEDCAALIASVNAKGFTPALLNMGDGDQQLISGARDGHRVIVDSPELADWLFQVIRPFLPAVLEDGSRLVELNERCRFLCYTPGQQFPVHADGVFERGGDHPHSGDFSHVTVQLYLHDIPAAFGGATAFMCPGKPRHQPEAGSVLLFWQGLLHEGCLVEEGVKYTLRTEAMYARPGSRAHADMDE
eukprot:TRINITY_DN23850_c0_g1_i1.p1 TRINITY_DN23850_c0_g1~~TRINITY_DN23850_c0_g1_i1.p1  ORF type:complete len:316 (+),score=47.19 TRINITY_DN23850_c0_g1_i1:48-950(+)